MGVRCADYADLRVRGADDAGCWGEHRPLRAGNAGDAGERAGNAVYAVTEKRHGTKGGTCEGRTLYGVAFARETDHAGLRAGHTENPGAPTGRDRRRVLHLAVDTYPGERGAGHPGELDGAALDTGVERIAVLLNRPLGIATAGESQDAGREAIPDHPEAFIRNIVVIRLGEEAEESTRPFSTESVSDEIGHLLPPMELSLVTRARIAPTPTTGESAALQAGPSS